MVAYWNNALADGPRLVVLITDSWQSRLLHAELTRDWTKTARGNNQRLAIYNHIQHSLRVKIDVDRGRVGLPCYRWSSRADWIPYDRRAFHSSTWPLLYTAWLASYKQWQYETQEWKLINGGLSVWFANPPVTLAEEQKDQTTYDYDDSEEGLRVREAFFEVYHEREPIWAKPIRPLPPWHPTARLSLMCGYNP